MNDFFAVPAARRELTAAVLNAILASEYTDEGDPHYHPSAEHADEQVAFAARELVRAIDAAPADEQPVGWNKPAEETQEPATEYLIWSNHYKDWWGPDRGGYTKTVADAGRYSLTDAQAQMVRTCGCCQVPEVPVPDDQLNNKTPLEVEQAVITATLKAVAEGRTNRCYTGEGVAR